MEGCEDGAPTARGHPPDSASPSVVAKGSVARLVGVRTTAGRGFEAVFDEIFPEGASNGSSGSIVSSKGVDALIVANLMNSRSDDRDPHDRACDIQKLMDNMTKYNILRPK